MPVCLLWLSLFLFTLTAPVFAQESEPNIVLESRGFFAPIPDAIWERMQNRSWHAGRKCPARETLALLYIPFIDFDGKIQTGEMIVAASVAAKVLDVFAEIYQSSFRIESIELIDRFDGDDARSMAANNTSAFNCRRSISSTKMSEHSFGQAIDINPLQNPYVSAKLIAPPSGAIFSQSMQRTKPSTGVIQPDGAVVRAFAKIGWKWGGFWNSTKDYQHFSATGR